MSSTIPPPNSIEHTIVKLVREEWGRMLAALVSGIHDWEIAEDCLQDAIERALQKWPTQGLPESPAAWLITAARRRAIDQFRRSKRFDVLAPELTRLIELNSRSEPVDIDSIIPDKRLELIFSCCHPALERKTQVALTLRTLGGLTTDEIASAFLDKPATLAQRLSRAKHKISRAKIPFEIPAPDRLPERVAAVLSVIYLIFNEGYTASSGFALTRSDLSDEAIRLARIILALMPDNCEVSGLLSLRLLHDSRRASRLNFDGKMVSLEYQNRNRWDQNKIEEGTALLKQTLKRQQIGPYQLQAAISAVHAESKDWAETDWAQINALYELLFSVQPSNVVRVNQAMAMSYAVSIESALALLETLVKDPSILRYQPFYAMRADLYARLGDRESALSDLEMAVELNDNAARRDFLQDRIKELSSIKNTD